MENGRKKFIVEAHLLNGTVLTGELQGSGGVVHTTVRGRKLLRSRWKELLQTRAKAAGGTVTMADVIMAGGAVAVWTDPENVSPLERFTTVPVHHLVMVHEKGSTDVFWSNPEIAEVSTDGSTVWVNGPHKCIGRYSANGMEILGQEPVPATDWCSFTTGMSCFHDIEIGDEHQPHWSKSPAEIFMSNPEIRAEMLRRAEWQFGEEIPYGALRKSDVVDECKSCGHHVEPGEEDRCSECEVEGMMTTGLWVQFKGSEQHVSFP